MNRVSSAPDSTRPGIGSAAVSRVSASAGSGSALATSTRFPNLRPRNTAASAMSATCAKTACAVATWARAWASGAPSATFAANTPPLRRTPRTAVMNSTDVRWAGVRPPANTSAITAS